MPGREPEFLIALIPDKEPENRLHDPGKGTREPSLWSPGGSGLFAGDGEVGQVQDADGKSRQDRCQ